MKIGSFGFKKILGGFKKFVLKYRIIILIAVGLFALFYAIAMFYIYAWQTPTAGLNQTQKVSIDSALYQKVMTAINQRQINSDQEGTKTYHDPF